MKSLEIVNEKIEDTKYPTGSLERPVWDDESIINTSELETIKQDLEVLETILDNCENNFLDVLHECLFMGNPIHSEDIQRLSGYINKILTIKKQWREEKEND